MTKRKPRDFSGLFLFMQKRDTYFSVEKVDERAHEESGQDRSDTNKSRDIGNFTLSKKEQCNTQDHTDYVGHDTDEFEFADLPFICHDESDCVIGGYPQVSGNIDRTAEAKGNEPKDETRDANHHGRIGKDRQQSLVGKIHHIAQQEQIDECGDANIMSVKNQGKQQ